MCRIQVSEVRSQETGVRSEKSGVRSQNSLGKLTACLALAAALTFGQGGNGTITGTVTDPAGAVVPGATVEAKNTQTGVVYNGASSAAGVYTISDLPVGTYSVTATVKGFKTYTHSNLALAATQVLREDIGLQVGTAAESVTVTEQSTLLKTETGELTHNITLEQMDDLPLLGIGTTNAGTTAIRNPFNAIQALPGLSAYDPGYGFTYNGIAQQASIRIEGQDATPHALGYEVTAQPGVDAVQEVAFQTSNYAPEFGTTGSVVVNFTMKSGTNQFHGSLYEYLVNEDLNAGDPFTVNANGVGKLRPRNRRNDFGGTLGGPVYIPKIYNGHNKTFFFFNYEQYLESTRIFNTDTVPTAAYLNGDFSAISANGTCSLCSTIGVPKTALGTPNIELDPAGQMIFANEIFDPATRAVATSGPKAGQGYASPFPNNMIPPTRFDPTTVDFLNLFQKLGVTAQNSNLVGNYLGSVPGNRYSVIPSFKIDQIISNKDKISFYEQETNLENQVSVGAPFGADGFPSEIGEYRGSFITGWVERLNYDRTISPTLLLHIGAGYYFTYFSDHAAFLNFNPSQFGLTGFVQDRQFPSITGNCSSTLFLYTCLGATGGMQSIGTVGQIQSVYHDNKPTYNANATWVHGRHTYKTGAELYVQGSPIRYYAGVTLNTGTNATSDPFTAINSLNGYSTGFGFASWLLGDYSSTTQTAPYDYRMGGQQWGLYVQDSWKVTRKLTVDYGLRWDLATTPHEQYGRLGQLDPTLPNANAGGEPGATRYASTCGCAFYQPNYPYAIGPRVGVAYQLDPKTVLRGGWGVVYTQVLGAALGSSQGIAGGIVSTNGTYPVAANSPSYIPPASQFVNIETPGSIVPPAWPVTDPNRYPVLGTTGGTPGGFVPDKNQNRPPRANQFSIGIQREITRNFVMEASYVGNRVVWLPTGPLGFFSQISPAKYAQFGLYPYPGTGPCSTGAGVCASSTYNNNNDRALLSLPLSSASVVQKLASAGITNFLPYTGFPTSNSLQSALYPFPQFGAIEPSTSATGNSKYDSLQMKATKRFSHGLQAGGAFTWAKGFTRATRQDFFNPASSVWDLQQIPPLALTFNFTYTVPKPSFVPKFASVILKDWQIGGYALYESGPFLTPPTSLTANFLSSEVERVPGQPLYLVDINNIHSYNPGLQQVLNPNAWAQCPTNSTCTATGTLYPDFRAPRTPTENANFGRNFRIKERVNLFIRAEFVNIFNRTLLPEPTSSGTGVSPQNPVTRTAGILSSGFGVIDTFATPGSQPSSAASSVLGVAPPYLTGRTGTLIARFTF
jgi:Carboxypeptidase regulatory-like domain/TonB dependent receptor